MTEDQKKRNRASTMAWKKAHPEKVKASNNRSIKKRRKEDPQRFHDTERRCMLKRKYGLTVEKYNALFTAQTGLCSICKNPLGDDTFYIHVDHNHDTGKVRGLLCNLCNVLLGAAREDIKILSSAMSYLLRTRGQ